MCGKEITGEHYSVQTGHHDWGGDSIDSIEYEHVCSAECMKNKINEYIEMTEGSCNSRYIEIEHESEPERIYENENNIP